jgi:hypothetical protein
MCRNEGPPTASPLPLAPEDFGTSRWQLSNETTPIAGVYGRGLVAETPSAGAASSSPGSFGFPPAAMTRGTVGEEIRLLRCNSWQLPISFRPTPLCSKMREQPAVHLDLCPGPTASRVPADTPGRSTRSEAMGAMQTVSAITLVRGRCDAGTHNSSAPCGATGKGDCNRYRIQTSKLELSSPASRVDHRREFKSAPARST